MKNLLRPSFLTHSSQAITSLPPLAPHTTPHSSLTRALTTQPQDAKPQPRETAIITGASGGIGSAIARRLAKEGHSCILIGRNTSKLDTVLRGLDTSRHAAPRNHRVEVGDVGKEEFWTELSKSLVLKLLPKSMNGR